MSKMLDEMRANFVATLSVLEASRAKAIEEKVSEYRKSLEESTPKDEIEKVTNVIKALDEVIQYESTTVSKEKKVDEEFVHVQEARPGMTAIFTPAR